MKRKVLIALNGYYCSGKSLVSKIFKAYGFDIWELDELIRPVFYKKQMEIINALNLDRDMLDKRGFISRRKLAKLVFGDLLKLRKLESILYPEFESYLEDCFLKIPKHEKVLVVSSVLYKMPILREKIFFSIFLETPMHRILKWSKNRDNLRSFELTKRILAQESLRYYNKNPDFVIYNEKGFFFLRNQVKACVSCIKNLLEGY